MVRLGVLIVTHNNRKDLAGLNNTLEEIRGLPLPCEVHIWDNASTDGTADILRTLEGETSSITACPENLGFGTAMNRLAAKCDSDIVLMLNPDCVVAGPLVEQCVNRFVADSRVAAVSPRIENPGMTALAGGYRLNIRNAVMFATFLGRIRPGRAWSRSIFAYAPEEQSEIALDWLAGTALFLRRDVFLHVGGFDEQWFMYGEDVDLGMRLSDRGYRQIMLLGPVAQHRVGGSHGGDSTPRTLWVRNLLSVYEKHATSPHRVRALGGVLALGFAVRAVLSAPGSPQRALYRAAAKQCLTHAIRFTARIESRKGNR